MMHKLKLAALIILLVVVALLVLQNTTIIQAHFLWYTKEISIITLLSFTAVGGVACGLLVAYLLERWRASAKH